MKDILAWHARTHPSIQPQDVIKLCYQAVFGAEHLLTDGRKARAYFDREWDSVAPIDIPLYEIISTQYVRVNLKAWKHAGLPREWLFRMFFLTASNSAEAGCADLQRAFDFVDETAAEQPLPFSQQEWRAARLAYEQQGGGAVHHSEGYRTAEHPAYRVIDRHYITLIPILKKLADMPTAQETAIVIAIDGRAASGKTTLAGQLADILGAGTVHMDDFFLPPELRTPARLAEAGGNVHYERFAEQVLPHLRHNGSFTYPAFNCSKMCLDGETAVSAGPYRVVEGSYSHHPELDNYMDLRVFCHVSPQEQMRRILIRNGEQMAKMFAERWIPMEEHYFDTYAVRAHADIQITTESNQQGETK